MFDERLGNVKMGPSGLRILLAALVFAGCLAVAPLVAHAGGLSAGITDFSAVEIKDSNVTLSEESYVYTGSAVIPKLSVSVDGRVLAEGEDYTVALKDNVNVGAASAIVTGRENYSGTVAKTFEIAPKAGKVASAKSKKFATAKVVAKTGSGGTRYQFGIGTSRSAAKIAKKATTPKSVHTFKKLAEGKTYYAFVRPVAKVNGKTIYGEWSNGKAVKVKTHPFVGSWELVRMEQNGDVTSSSELSVLKKVGLSVTMKMSKKRTFSLNLFGDKFEGTWKASTERSGTATADGESIKLTYKNKKLTVEQRGASLTFNKK